MLCFVFAALVVLLDQLFKRWIVLALEIGAEKGLIPGLLGLTHVQNYGAAFSILEGKRWLLAVVMFICVIVIISILLRYNEGFWGTLGLAAVLGGAVGNLADRVFYGYVVDMFEFRFINFAVFNVADIFITLGGITFIVFFIVSTIRSDRDEKASAELLDERYLDDENHDDEYSNDNYSRNREFASEDGYDSNEPEYEYIENYDELFNGSDSIGSDVAEYIYEEPVPPPSALQTASTRSKERQTTGLKTDEYYETVPSTAENRTSDDDINHKYAENGAPKHPRVDKNPQAKHKTSEYSSGEIQPDSTPILTALDELESELVEIEDYDIDKILREYGFEEDND